MNLLDFPIALRLHQKLFALAYRAHEAELEMMARLPEIVRAVRPSWPAQAALGLDIGAGLGPYALYMLRHCRQTLLIEPNHAQAAYLRTAFGRRAYVVEAAASDAPGTAFLVDSPSRSGWRRPLARVSSSPASTGWTQPCNVETVDGITERLGLHDLAGALIAKIDVEGHEFAVLNGMAGLLKDRQALLIVEIEARMNPATKTVFELMAEQGFDCRVYDGGRLVPGSHDMVVAMAGRTPGRLARLTGYRSNFIFLR